MDPPWTIFGPSHGAKRTLSNFFSRILKKMEALWKKAIRNQFCLENSKKISAFGQILLFGMLVTFFPIGPPKNDRSFMSKYFWNINIVTVPLTRLNPTLQKASFNILSKTYNHLNKKYTALKIPLARAL